MRRTLGAILALGLVFGAGATSANAVEFGPEPGGGVASGALREGGDGNADPGTNGDHTDPARSADPTESADPGDPADASDPSDPKGQTDPSEPTDPLDPSNPLDPSDPTDPGDPEPIEFPEPIVAPAIVRDTAQVGRVASVHVGEWGVADASFSARWLRDGAPIDGATGTSYTPVPADAGRVLSVAVTAEASGYTPATRTTQGVTVGVGALTPGAVKIAGAASVGKQLSVATTGWAPSDAAVSYTWTRNGAAIAGATADRYTLVAADQGKRIAVRAEGRLAGYGPSTVTSASTAAVTAGTLATAAPAARGSAVVGRTLTASTGTWTAKTSFSYQWKRNGAAIARATGSSYKLTSSDAGRRITVTVTGKQLGYTTASRTSGATAVVLRTLTSTPTPKISGTSRVGSTLSVTPGSWKPAPVKLSYRWYRNGAPISGATRTNYRLTGADGGKQITVRVTGARSGYVSTVKASAVRSIPRVMQAGIPKVSGSAKVGSTLRGSAGSWTSGTSLRYQWLRNGAAVRGATGTNYRLTAADAGKTIRLRVTGVKSGYASESRTSASTARVGYPSRTAPIGWNCPAWAPIKGNQNSRGEWIYHVPGGAFYGRTNPEECFSSEAAARSAGYRRSLR